METYHTQPPAKNAKSKKKQKGNRPTPHYFNRTVPTSTEPKKKPVQPRHLLEANTQINCTGPTRHKAEPHTDRKFTTQPARKVPTNPAPK